MKLYIAGWLLTLEQSYIFLFSMDFGFNDLLAKVQSPLRPGVATQPHGAGGLLLGVGDTGMVMMLVGNAFCVSSLMNKDVCGGGIGAGGTFCSRSAGACKVKSHQLTCHEFENKGENFYVVKTGEVALSNPHLKSLKVSDDLTTKDWIGLSLSSAEWVWLFSIAEGGNKAATQDLVKASLQAKGTADLYKTPAKQTKGLSSINLKQENEFASSFLPFQPSILVNLEKEDEMGPLDPERMRSDNTNLENGLVATGTRLTVVLDYFEHELLAQDDIIQTMALKLELAFEMIGKLPRGFPLQFQAPDMWVTLSLIIDSLTDTGTDNSLSMVVQAAIEFLAQGLKDSLLSLQLNAWTMFKAIINCIIMVEEKVHVVEETTTANVNHWPGSLENNPFGLLMNGTHQPDNTSGDQILDNIVERLEKVEAAQNESNIWFTKQLGLTTLEDTKS